MRRKRNTVRYRGPRRPQRKPQWGQRKPPEKGVRAIPWLPGLAAPYPGGFGGRGFDLRARFETRQERILSSRPTGAPKPQKADLVTVLERFDLKFIQF